MIDSFETEGALKLGGLPPVNRFCDRLSLAQIIDNEVPMAPQGLIGPARFLPPS
jgi:hypothetical protein